MSDRKSRLRQQDNKRPNETKRHDEPKVLKLEKQAKGDSLPDVSSKEESKKLKTLSDANLSSKSKGKPAPDVKSRDITETKSPYFVEDDPQELDEGSDEGTEEGSDDDKDSVKLPRSFYERSCESLAKALLGQVLVRIHNGQRLTGKIIETESYLGRRDKAAHSYKGKTDRNTAMFMDPGTSYVYNIYGMYCCMNISSQGEGEAVLIRSLEPLEGKPIMSKIRAGNRKNNTTTSKPMKDRDLCNGPSKLTQALSINKAAINQVDLATSDVIWLEKGEAVPDNKIVVSKRINIAYAEEWTDKPLRFYELGNPCVSVKDKEAEKLMKQTNS